MEKVIYTIGITGGSGSGKTHFINALAKRFDETKMCIVSQDHYYKSQKIQQVDDHGVINFDIPEAIDLEQFHQDILRLKQGESIRKTEYTFNNPESTASTIEFKPAPILVIEGLFVQYHQPMEKELDLRIFIEAKDYVKVSRRIRRDNDERGYDLDDVLYRYNNHVMPVYETLIEPLKHHADFIVPNNHQFNGALEILTLALKAKLYGLKV